MKRVVLAAGLAFSVAAFTSGHADSDLAPVPLTVSGPRDPEQALFVGDADLRPLVELERMQLADGRFQVGLEDGRTVILTLDPALQAHAEKVLAQAEVPIGALVILSLDGRILALAARRDGAPDASAETALEAWAPAASIFKVVTSAALVDAGVALDEEVCYHGGLRSVEESHLVDDAKRDDACASFTFGLAKSQNAIIAKLAARHLDAAALRRAATAFGFGQAPDFALQADPARVTVPEGKLERARVAAGFWSSELSALGGALVAGVVASGGLEVTPRIVEAVIGRDGLTRPVLPRPPRRVLSLDTAEALAEMLLQTTVMGTAFSAFHDPKGRPLLDAQVAGKTGSLSRAEPYLHYSWFVGFAPADEPRLLVSALLGNGPRWRVKAHTAARLLLEPALAR